jgi:hypothetical protein
MYYQKIKPIPLQTFDFTQYKSSKKVKLIASYVDLQGRKDLEIY